MTPDELTRALRVMSLADAARHFSVSRWKLASFMRQHGIISPRYPGLCIRRPDNLGIEGRRKGGRKAIHTAARHPNGHFAEL